MPPVLPSEDPVVAPPPPAAVPCTPESREELIALVSRSFGIENGYKELNGAITAAAGFDMFDRIGMADSPMRLVVAELAKAVEGEGKVGTCIEALFLAYPGNPELRGWVAAHDPALHAKVSDTAFEAARTDYETDRQVRRVGIIAANLTAVGPAIRLDPAQMAVSKDMVAKLDDLEAYKAVHDFLHGLQGTVLFELDRIASPTIIPDDRKDSISRQLDDLKLAAMAIRNLRDRSAALTREPEMCDTIQQSLLEVSATLNATDQGDALTARRGFIKLRAMLRAQMALFDGLMVKTSQAIPFTQLAQILRDLAEPKTGPQPPETKKSQLLTTAEALEDTSRRLALRRDIHQLWQRMDAILHTVEEVLWGSGRLEELVIHWEDVVALLDQLNAKDTQELTDINGLALPINLAAVGGFAAMSDTLKRDFNRFIAKVRGRFRIVDEALKQDCQELRRLHEPLGALLENPE